MRKLKLFELNRVDIEVYHQMKKLPVRLVLDHIRSVYNVGAVFRTADAFLIEKVHLCGITACPPHRGIRKTALGAEESVAWEYHESALDAAHYLKKDGWYLIGMEQTDNSILLYDFVPNRGEKYALFFGNEVAGLSDILLPHLHVCIEIPQCGTKHSLNIAVSAGIAVWHFYQFLHSRVK